MINAAFRSTTGEGRPRVIVDKTLNTWQSVGATIAYGTNTVIETIETAKTISSSGTNDAIITTLPQTWAEGDRLLIAGHTGSTPNINGLVTIVDVIDVDEYRIDRDITAGGTGGTAQKVPRLYDVRAGMRVVVTVPRSGLPDLYVYARVVSVDEATSTITVDSWVGGTPEPNNAYRVNGWCLDLPYCESIVQKFTPHHLVHPLWRKRVETRFYGYEYEAALSWATRIKADDVYYMVELLNQSEDDRIVLVPHTDKPGYAYNVYLADALEVSPFGLAGGHKGFALTFKGKHLVSYPANVGGYGFNYALNYGYQL